MQDDNSDPEVPSAERQSFLRLTRELASLPLEQSAAALETSAAIAGISLRASIEFLRAAPAAAEVLQAAELRAWGDLGRRLAMGDVETAITFFAEGVNGLSDVPAIVHPLVFQLCARQITLSSPIAVETFRNLPALTKTIEDPEALASVLEVAMEIARRSAKHSAEFLRTAPAVLDRLRRARDPALRQRESSWRRSLRRAPAALRRTRGLNCRRRSRTSIQLTRLRLINATLGFLERGGGSALQVLITGGGLLRTLPEIFDEWVKLLWTVAQHGNASLVAFVRSSPRFVRALGHETDRARLTDLALRVVKLTREIAETDGEAALACFRSSGLALRTVSIEQFEQWARQGLAAHSKDARARRSYFALETRGSYDALEAAAMAWRWRPCGICCCFTSRR